MNADVNAALNIVRKSKREVALNDQLCKGLSSSPKRIYIDHISVLMNIQNNEVQ